MTPPLGRKPLTPAQELARARVLDNLGPPLSADDLRRLRQLTGQPPNGRPAARVLVSDVLPELDAIRKRVKRIKDSVVVSHPTHERCMRLVERIDMAQKRIETLGAIRLRQEREAWKTDMASPAKGDEVSRPGDREESVEDPGENNHIR